MREASDKVDDRRLRVGSLFSGYGELDLAVEQVFDTHTIWFAEINEPVVHVFARHWPNAPTSATSPPSTGTPSSPSTP